jgi:hypothetical protein
MTELERQQAHYKAVRERLYNPPNRRDEPKPPPPAPPVVDVEALVQAVKAGRDLINVTRLAVTEMDCERQAQQLHLDRPAIIRRVIREVCDETGYTPEDLFGDQRYVPLVRARQAAYARVFDEAKIGLSHIGRIFGNRDHTTILWGIKQHKAKQSGTPLPRKPFRKPPNRPAKLTMAQVIEIRRLHEQQRYTRDDLARMFNCGGSTVTDIVHRRSWKHI